MVTIFLSLRARLHTLAAAILHSPEEADDVLHDAFIKLWNRGERGEEQMAGSLVVAVRNGCIDRLRRKSRVDGQEGRLASLSTDSAARADAREEVERILRFVRTQVPPAAARAFEMYVVDDLEYADIADRMGITIELARTYVSRTRKRIRQKFSNLS